MHESICQECGASLTGVKTCREYFDQMLVWDFEDFATAGSAHHLTVLCYYLQHPSLYSPEALLQAKQFLKEIIETNATGQELLDRNRDLLSSQKRNWQFAGTPGRSGRYAAPIPWSMTADQVVAGGVTDYPARVWNWARSVYEDIKQYDKPVER